jgi:AraC family transcriptional regulator, regulatory protein of adaptative response / DNA-3-methyladenine glycosylase II
MILRIADARAIRPHREGCTGPKTASQAGRPAYDGPMSDTDSLHDDAAYQALRAHDARFDGRLFIGVTSTGIYCRPVCRVKPPRRENCRFFANAALAETQGFRPCLRCRPELAPGLSFTDSSSVLADQAARWLAQAAHAGQDPTLPSIAARLGVTDRHLRRIFAKRHGVTPVAWLATQRLLLAKQLLTDTALPVTQVALATGFGSLRRFHAAFSERYRLSPSALRREGAAEPGALKLAWRPPFDLDGLLGFIARRAVPGQEQVDGLILRRTLALPHQSQVLAGWIEARFLPARCELHLAVAPVLRPALGALLQRARHAFDLDADPAAIDPVLASVPGPARPGLRLPGSWCGFETAVRVVLGQQVSVAAARTLCQRLVQRFGSPVETPFQGLDRLFPSAQALAAADAADIGTLGIVRQRVRALQGLARAVADGHLQLEPGADVARSLATLTALPGIGDWSAQLIALRTLGWPDAWPAADIALLKALGQTAATRDPAAGAAMAEAWRPWRGYAVFKLWLSLEHPVKLPLDPP